MATVNTSMINIHDAKTQLSRLLAEVERGASITIARAGKPAARLVPVADASARIGFLAGQMKVPDDFDSMAAADIAALFDGQR
jgi:prevent-host-death family protein